MSLSGFLLIGFLIAVGVYYFTRSAVVGVLVALVFVSVVHMFTSNSEEKHQARLEAKYGDEYLKYEHPAN